MDDRKQRGEYCDTCVCVRLVGEGTCGKTVGELAISVLLAAVRMKQYAVHQASGGDGEVRSVFSVDVSRGGRWRFGTSHFELHNSPPAGVV